MILKIYLVIVNLTAKSPQIILRNNNLFLRIYFNYQFLKLY